MPDLIPIERIANMIYLIRDIRVMLDRDLAALYGVETKVLKQAVRRNIRRFPDDFMFELTEYENRALRSQNVTLKRGQHSKYLPYAFTEQGVAMLSSVLSSERAIQVNILIMRAFTKLREMLSTHEDLRRKVEAMERKYDRQFKVVFDAIKKLIDIESKPKRKIGFEVKEQKDGYGKKGKKSQKKA
jgi:phage regulator Rha-like protein